MSNDLGYSFSLKVKWGYISAQKLESEASRPKQFHVSLTLKEKPRPPYVHHDFDQLRLDFPELGGYFPVPEL